MRSTVESGAAAVDSQSEKRAVSQWRFLTDPEVPAQEFFRAWLDMQCSMISGVVRGVLVLGEPDVGPYIPQGFWPDNQSASPALALAAERTLQLRQEIVKCDSGTSIISCPLLIDNHLHGLAAIEANLEDDVAMQEAVRRLRWGLHVIETRLRQQQSHQEQVTRERLIATLDVVAAALVESSFEAAAGTLATELALRLDCDRVSIGFVDGHHTRVVAVSHSAQFGKRMNLISTIGEAMDESLDQKSIILIPELDSMPMVIRSHLALSRSGGSGSILTVPFSVGEVTTGAFTFERPESRTFSADDIELCQAITSLCSRILESKRLNERLLPLRIKDALRDQLEKISGPRHFARKIAASFLVFGVLFFSVAGTDYQVGANATVEGYVHRALVAPFDGYVASASRRAGDIVAKGTELASMDDNDIKLEYLKWVSQRGQYGKQYQDALAQHDRAESSIALAQMQQAEAQAELYANQLARTNIKAPFDGVVVSGDLSQSLGSAVKRGQVLFEIAPLNQYRVILEVDQADIVDIRSEQKGVLKLTSLPDEEFPLTVIQLTPVSSSREGRSYFRVEAILDRISDRLKPGMEGVGKVDVGRRKLIWVWTHDLFDWLRLFLWSW